MKAKQAMYQGNHKVMTPHNSAKLRVCGVAYNALMVKLDGLHA